VYLQPLAPQPRLLALIIVAMQLSLRRPRGSARSTAALLTCIGLACSGGEQDDSTTGLTGLTGITAGTGNTAGNTGTTSGASATATATDSATDSGASGETSADDPPPKFDLDSPDSGDDPEEPAPPAIPTTCEEALAGVSTVGCRFFAVDMDSHDLAEGGPYAVAVANVQLEGVATVTVEVKNGGVWQPIAGPQPIAALQLATFPLPARNTDDSMVLPGGAYRITADTPVVAYQFNPVDGASSYLSDASMLYPVPALDTINDVVGWTSMMDNSNTFQHGYATIIATADGTEVKVTPGPATAAGNGVPAGTPGVPFTINLQEGDVLSVAVASLATSMTGTKVVSNYPVAVFSGQECALIPASTCCCDHMEEQIAGLRQWGSNFIAARMPVRNAGSPETSLWQIYASEDATEINIAADPGVTGINQTQLTLNRGQMLEMYVGGSPGAVGDFQVTASKPIGVFNYMTGSENMPSPYNLTGDPAMVQLSPIEQFLPRYVVLVPGTWVNDIAVLTRPAGAQITIDGVAVADSAFLPVAGGAYEVGRVPIPDGVHVLDGGDSRFGVVIVGYDDWDSYAYLGGTGTGKINPNPPG
jgi:hypothetical protein